MPATARTEDHTHAVSDGALLELARDRSESAAREFMQRYNQRLYRVAYSILQSAADAEEIVQDIYVKLFTGQAVFKGDAAMATWLTRIAANAALDRRRTQRRRARLLEERGIAMIRTRSTDTDDTPISHASPESDTARYELARRLEAAMEKISDTFRPVFVLREIEGLSIEETSAALGLAVNTVKSRHARARRQLAAMLEPDWRDILQGTFPFAGTRCADLADRVIHHLQTQWKGRN